LVFSHYYPREEKNKGEDMEEFPLDVGGEGGLKEADEEEA